MAKQTTAPQDTPAVQPSTAVQVIAPGAAVTVDDVFNRQINSIKPVKSITFKRTLTKALVAMAHQMELLFQVTGAAYNLALPVAGRSDKPQDALVIDGVNLETGEEIALVLNEMMVSGFAKALPPDVLSTRAPDVDFRTFLLANSAALIGKAFAMRAGDIKADKRYRVVDVVEVDVER